MRRSIVSGWHVHANGWPAVIVMGLLLLGAWKVADLLLGHS